VHRAVGVALATVPDAENAAAGSGIDGTLAALRGGTYTTGGRAVSFDGARVVRDALGTGRGREASQRHDRRPARASTRAALMTA
jgi:hypothetical protein